MATMAASTLAAPPSTCKVMLLVLKGTHLVAAHGPGARGMYDRDVAPRPSAPVIGNRPRHSEQVAMHRLRVRTAFEFMQLPGPLHSATFGLLRAMTLVVRATFRSVSSRSSGSWRRSAENLTNFP